MFKIFKKIKERVEKGIIQYAQKDINELSKILNRPKEGEIVKLENIKIQKHFKQPNYSKIKHRKEYYKRHKYFRTTIVLDNNNYLIDGYTTYLLAKPMKFDYITILRKWWKLWTISAIVVQSF